jgi:hypothetical protein
LSEDPPKNGSITNPLGIPATHRVAFGYLRDALGMVHAVDAQGRPDETRLVGLYRSGQGHPPHELSAAAGEAVRIDGRFHRVIAGQVWPAKHQRAGQRRDGVLLIDLDSPADTPEPSA